MLLTTVQNARQRAMRRAGFTLLEVLVVVAILVILAGVASVATMRYLEDAKKSKAQLGCKAIAQAAEAYQTNPANTTNDLPDIQSLLQPAFGTSYLKNGQEDLMDPWGGMYQMKAHQQGDGSISPLVYTIAKDGTPISQYGIGPASRVNQ